jgi:hypothetical protein
VKENFVLRKNKNGRKSLKKLLIRLMDDERQEQKMKGWRAIVLGGTGATGRVRELLAHSGQPPPISPSILQMNVNRSGQLSPTLLLCPRPAPCVQELVRELIESPKWSHVTLINRRQADEFQSGAPLSARLTRRLCFSAPRPPLSFLLADKVEQVVVNMDEMEEHAESFKDHDVVCLSCTFDARTHLSSLPCAAHALTCQWAGVLHVWHDEEGRGVGRSICKGAEEEDVTTATVVCTTRAPPSERS